MIINRLFSQRFTFLCFMGFLRRVKSGSGFFVPAGLYRIAIIYFLSSTAVYAASNSYHDVEIISSNNFGIDLRFKIADANEYISRTSGDTSSYPVRSILIGVPVDAEPFITDVRSGNPINVETPTSKRPIPRDQAMARIIQTKIIRGRKIATLNIFPYRNGTIYREIEVDISFQNDGESRDMTQSSEEDKVFDPMFRSSVLNYEEFRTWPALARKTAAYKAAQNPFAPATVWYKITTLNEGLTKITGQNLASAGLSLGNLQSDSIRLFYGGGEPLQVLNSRPRPSMNEVFILVVDGDDGKFDYSDYILFFAESAERWRYPADSTPVYLENPYTGANCYWLAVSGNFAEKGKRMVSIDGSVVGTPDTIITGGRFYARAGQNRMLMHDNGTSVEDYYTWYWTDQSQFTFYMDLPSALASESSLVRIRAKTPHMNLSINDAPAVQILGDSPDFRFLAGSLLHKGNNKFSISMTANYDSPPHFDFCELSYGGSLEGANSILDATINSGYDRTEISANNNFGGIPYIFELSNSGNPILITGANISSDKISFQYPFGSAPSRRFYLCSQGKAYSPVQIDRIAQPDLVDNVAQTDMFVIAPRQFVSGLQSYVSYRSLQTNLNVKLVALEDIFNQFSFGQYDPTAIRDFLKYAYENYPSPAPSAALLVGDGNYDFKNYLNTATQNLVPPYIHRYDSTSSDDNYVYFGEYGILDGDTSYSSDRGYDMMISRWPVKSASQLNTVVAKVKSYESSTNFAPWRATVTLVADDEFGANEVESFHTTQTEELQKYHLPSAFRRNKIYSWDYPFDSNRQKTAVNDAIVRSFNDGALLINYVGHGNPDTWAHEHIFGRNSDLPRLQNGDRLALVFTASCSIGFFDDPTREGMAEDLLRLPNAGAIATVAATRLVYAGENADFNRQFYDILFGADSLSICQAVYTAKLLREYSYSEPRPIRNDRTYAFFGDPFLKLGVPHFDIKFTDFPDTIRALALHEVGGEIVIRGLGAPADFNGTLDIFVYDSEIQKFHNVYFRSGQLYDSVNYSLGGPIIYRGTAVVENGRFNFSFIAPLDIGYGGKAARILGYAVSNSADAFGLADSIPVSPKISSGGDTRGPEIEYTFSNRKDFVSGDKIALGEKLKIHLSDSLGLNLIGGLGHEMTLIIDDRLENIVNLTDLFEYETGSCTHGNLDYDLGNLEPGIHSFKIKVWDNANNSAVAKFTAEVIESSKLMITDLLNYPNPMKDETTISFALSSSARSVNLKIFTVAGKMIFEYEKNSIPADFYRFCSWDGRDSDGDRVASGVYIYKVTAVSEQSDETVESFGKVVVVN